MNDTFGDTTEISFGANIWSSEGSVYKQNFVRKYYEMIAKFINYNSSLGLKKNFGVQMQSRFAGFSYGVSVAECQITLKLPNIPLTDKFFEISVFSSAGGAGVEFGYDSQTGLKVEKRKSYSIQVQLFAKIFLGLPQVIYKTGQKVGDAKLLSREFFISIDNYVYEISYHKKKSFR